MNTQAAKQQDEDYQDFILLAAKNCDKGISLEFRETRLNYWLPETTSALQGGFVPKEGDIVRIYGKLEATEYTEKIVGPDGKEKTVKRKKTNYDLIRGIDIIRVTEDDENRKKRTKHELFYKTPEAKKPAAEKASA